MKIKSLMFTAIISLLSFNANAINFDNGKLVSHKTVLTGKAITNTNLPNDVMKKLAIKLPINNTASDENSIYKDDKTDATVFNLFISEKQPDVTIVGGGSELKIKNYTNEQQFYLITNELCLINLDSSESVGCSVTYDGMYLSTNQEYEHLHILSLTVPKVAKGYYVARLTTKIEKNIHDNAFNATTHIIQEIK